MRSLPVLLLLAGGAASATTIGKSVPPPPLSAERVASLPAKDRPAWLAYLDRSARQRRADRLALDAELKAAGMTQPLIPPSGSAARSIPLNRPAEWYAGEDARRVARIVVSFQTPAGGWSKNLDMADHERRKAEHYAANNASRYLAPGDFDTPHDPGWNYVGTLDNDATTTQLRFLARVIAAAGSGDTAPFRASFLRGIQYLLNAQYPNGGWPQVWPLEGGYHDAITFNDGALGETLGLLGDVAGGKGDFAFVPAAVRTQAARAVGRGVECILAAQVVDRGVLTVWGQQHDALTLKPVAARNYEPAALCSSESAGVVQILKGLPHPNARVTKAVDAATAWFRKVAIHDRRYVRDRQGGHVDVQPGALLWARFYEIGTDRPIFGDRDQSIHDTLDEISLERRAGYSWYVTTPQTVLDAAPRAAAGPVYVVLWFDTEDYIEPAADDAALRIARDLTAEGVRATFKVVGEKARVLESRGRRDVIAAVSKHAIGYHSNWHSVHPTPAEYLVHFGLLDGADEFERREGPGLEDVKRIFGTQPACYGQPGNSWAPQALTALRRMGVRVYLDEGDQVGVGEQPFWYGGLLHVYNMGRNQFRAQLNVGAEDTAAYRRFDETAERLAKSGGGVISIYYHPTEFIATEFWDAVNFSRGRNPERDAWVKPHRRTADDSERCYGVLRRFVQHMKQRPGVRFVTAQDLPALFEAPPARVDRAAAAEQLRQRIVFDEMLSPAEMLLAVLGLPPQTVDGPIAAGKTTYTGATIPAAVFRKAASDAADFIRRFHRLPNEVFLGADTLSLGDFAATVGGNYGKEGDAPVVRGKIEFDRYFALDGRKPFSWVIHPENFDGAPLLDLARLQGWTLKPARLRRQ
jgi:PelA/Pel-15E family pectate lyase